MKQIQNYLRIQNKGLIVPEDLTLIGSSTKTKDDTKIGQFGSGWKYALAYLMRNEATPIILAGNRRIDVDYEVVLHRDTPVKVITIDGYKTSITTDMGMLWKAWMAIREIVSNAIDEGDSLVTTSIGDNFDTDEDTTAVYIPITKAIQDIIINYDHYFAFDREVYYTSEDGYITLFKNETKKFPSIYRKGIRCYDDDIEDVDLSFDIDLPNLNISEDRITTWSDILVNIKSSFSYDDLPHEFIKEIILLEKGSFLPRYLNNSIREFVKKEIKNDKRFTSRSLAQFGGMLLGKYDYKLPNSYYNKLVEEGILTREKGFDETMFKEVDSEENRNIAENLEKSLLVFGIPLKVKIGTFVEDTDITQNNYYIKLNDRFKHENHAKIIARLFYTYNLTELQEIVHNVISKNS